MSAGKFPRPVDLTEYWTITDHCCRWCRSRILQRADGQAYRCMGCNLTTIPGAPVEAICGCGIRREGQRKGSRSPFECGPDPFNPSQIVVLFNGLPISAQVQP